MGAEIKRKNFSRNDFVNFRYNLERETQHLFELVDANKVSNKGYSVGLELEGWLVDSHNNPTPKNFNFLKKINHPQVVSELNQCSFEINGLPQNFNSSAINNISRELEALFKVCQEKAQQMNMNALLAGCPPTFCESHLNLMSNQRRFQALQEQILLHNRNKEITVHVCGQDELKKTYKHIMLASATAALHIQVKIPFDYIPQFYNSALMISAPTVAASSNTPFLFQKNLWHESRVPIFEHSVNTAPSVTHRTFPRALFANNYINNVREYFDLNLNEYPIILADSEDTPLDKFRHVNLHNGTIWRWNRLVVGHTDDIPHFRIEHRSIPSGPSLIDTRANIAFFIGLLYDMGTSEAPLEKHLHFYQAEKNFYKCAKYGLNAEVKWIDGKTYVIKDLLLDRLLEQSVRGLKKAKMDSLENIRLIEGLLHDRIKTGQTGSQWQMDYAKKHGNQFKDLLECYIKQQQENIPVHLWDL